MFENSLPRAALKQCANALQKHGMDDAQSAARLLLCDVTGTDIHGILMSETPLYREQAARLTKMIQRVMKNEPVQYVLGYAHFYGLRLMVSPDVLIPRPDTETVVEWAQTNVPHQAKVLDVCTGSGCIAIALGHVRKDIQLSASDISERALDVARINAAQIGVPIEFRSGDLCAPFDDTVFDVIVSNPPYISALQMESLSENVRDFEPHTALHGGADGLDIIRRLIPQASMRLKEGGHLCIEIGYEQSETVTKLFGRTGFRNICVFNDTAKRPRVVAGSWEGRL